MLEIILGWSRKKIPSVILILMLYSSNILLAHTSSSTSRSSNIFTQSFQHSRKIVYLALGLLSATLPSSQTFMLSSMHSFKMRTYSTTILKSKNDYRNSLSLNARAGDNLDAFSPSGKFYFVFEIYLQDIEHQTGLAIGDKQRALVIHALSTQTFSMVNFKINKKFHKRFQRKKSKLIKKWEAETGLPWPRYYKDIYNNKGDVIRFKGQPYDAHHIIECVFTGPSEWWNIHPASTQEEHQEGIHRIDGPAWWVFYDNCQNEDGCHLFAEPEYIEKAS